MYNKFGPVKFQWKIVDSHMRVGWRVYVYVNAYAQIEAFCIIVVIEIDVNGGLQKLIPDNACSCLEISISKRDENLFSRFVHFSTVAFSSDFGFSDVQKKT